MAHEIGNGESWVLSAAARSPRATKTTSARLRQPAADEAADGPAPTMTKRWAMAFSQAPKRGRGRPSRRCAAVTVFAISSAMVMGPTPPGTGVIAPATAAASA